MNNKIFSATCIVLIALNGVAHATLIAWNDNIPSSLQPFQNNPQQLANLAQDRIFIYSLAPTKISLPTAKNQNPTVTLNTAAVVLPIDMATAKKTISSYEQYVGLFPSLKSAKILEQSGNLTQVKYRVSIPTPIPVLNFNESVTFQHQLGSNSLASIVIDGPIPYGAGKFEWFSLGTNKTLVTLTQWGDLDQPKGFLISKILKTIPEVKQGIPTGTNAFILESLRKRYGSNKITALAPGQFPSPQLNAAQLEKITQLSRASNQPVSYINNLTTVPYQHGAESMRFSTTYQYYAQTPQQLQKWTQAASYKALFPKQIKNITTTALQNKSQNADFKISVGLGVISIPFDFKMHFNYPNATENAFNANGGDIKYIKGQMLFNAQSQGSLLKMTSAMKIDESAPFLLRSMRSLPYHDVLPAVAGNAVFAQKIRTAK